MQGMINDPRQCLECGELLPIPHNVGMRRHVQCRQQRAEQKRAYNAQYYREHSEQSRAYMAQYYQEHLEQQRAYKTKRRHEQSEKVRAISRRSRDRRRQQVLAAYGSVCQCCGEERKEFLAIDHINGNGGRHRRELALSGVRFYDWLWKEGFPHGYQVLCHNCNSSRGIHGYCPHETVSALSARRLGGPLRTSKQEKRLEYDTKYRQTLRQGVLEAYGSTCQCCSEERNEFLAVDHIDGNGARQRRELGVSSGSEFYLWLRKNSFPPGYRVLCHNCNSAKGYYGYCPHETPSSAATPRSLVKA
jgi:hypothetical protein